jgi:hypothetical protein
MEVLYFILKIFAPIVAAVGGCIGVVYNFIEVPREGNATSNDKVITIWGYVMLILITFSSIITVTVVFIEEAKSNKKTFDTLQRHGHLLSSVQENIRIANESTKELLVLQDHSRRLQTTIDPTKISIAYNLFLPHFNSTKDNNRYIDYLQKNKEKVFSSDGQYLRSRGLIVEGRTTIFPVTATFSKNSPLYPNRQNGVDMYGLLNRIGAKVGLYYPPIPQDDLKNLDISKHKNSKIAELQFYSDSPDLLLKFNSSYIVEGEIHAQGVMSSPLAYGGGKLSSLFDFEGAQLLIRFDNYVPDEITDFSLRDELYDHFNKHVAAGHIFIDLGTGLEKIPIRRLQRFKIKNNKNILLYAYNLKNDLSEAWPRLLIKRGSESPQPNKAHSADAKSSAAD